MKHYKTQIGFNQKRIYLFPKYRLLAERSFGTPQAQFNVVQEFSKSCESKPHELFLELLDSFTLLSNEQIYKIESRRSCILNFTSNKIVLTLEDISPET